MPLSSVPDDEIFANAVRLVAAPYYGIIDMRYLKSRQISDAIASLNGCCWNGLLPPFYRIPFPSIIFHPFFQNIRPRYCRRTEIKSICLLLFPNKNVADVGKRVVKKKLIASHFTSLLSGFITVLIDKLNQTAC